MAQNITLLGASYSDVPAVTLPKTGGGTARFTDATPTTAVESDVASGKTFIKADGSLGTGTASGGGGGDTVFLVTISWDDDYFDQGDGAWVPDCTFAEIEAAFNAGKQITVDASANDQIAEGWFIDGETPGLEYEVDELVPDSNFRIEQKYYWYDSTGLYFNTTYVYVEQNLQSLSRTYTPTNQTQTETITPGQGYTGIEEVSITVNAMPTGTAGTPTATKGSVSNHAVTVTPSVTNTAGYISGGTKTGTGVSVSASELVSGSETKTANGTYDVTNLASLVVNVSGGGGSPMNVQVAAGCDRVATTSYTAVTGQSITVAETGTYDVYWTGYRSSTSGTNGSQLYIGSSAYGTAQTTFTNNGQAVHLTGVSLTKNQVVTVRARARATNYYMYVGNLTIVQTA